MTGRVTLETKRGSRIFPAGYLKLPNVVYLTRRMRIQYVQYLDGFRQNYPRQTKPRRSVDEFAKHLEYLIFYGTVDVVDIIVKDPIVPFSIHARTTGIPAEEERKLRRDVKRDELIDFLVRGYHVSTTLGDFPVYFHSGRDHDLIITSGPDLWLGKEIEMKGSSTFEKHLRTRLSKFVLRVPFSELKNVRQQHTFVTSLAQRSDSPDEVLQEFSKLPDITVKYGYLIYPALVSIIRPTALSRLPVEAIARELAEELYDEMISSIYELHRKRRGRYSKSIRTNRKEFDPSL